MKRWFIAVIASLVLVPWALAQKDAPAPAPKEQRGTAASPRKSPSISGSITVGDAAPGFELDAPGGNSVPLRSLRGSWIVLAFADRWQQLYPLQDLEEELRGMGARVVGVCHEKAHTLSGVAKREKLSLLLLADVTGQVSSMYGLFSHQSSETRPGFLVVDPNGVVQLTVLGQLPPNDVVARLARFAITGV